MKTINSTATTSLSRVLLMTLAIVASVAAGPAFAEGLDKVNTTMENVLTMLHGVSLTVVTIAIIWSGYKMAFQHARVMDIAPILGGGLLVGGAAEIAAYMLK